MTPAIPGGMTWLALGLLLLLARSHIETSRLHRALLREHAGRVAAEARLEDARALRLLDITEALRLERRWVAIGRELAPHPSIAPPDWYAVEVARLARYREALEVGAEVAPLSIPRYQIAAALDAAEGD